MKLQFDAAQDYQLQAINSVVNLFDGQPLNRGEFEAEELFVDQNMLVFNSFVVGNNLVLTPEAILKNLQRVQKQNQLEISNELDGRHFSSEMETGTGKTYVYLRTIHELYRKYGFKKFVIVVPSIAIKEGVMKNLQITREHFDLLYDKPEMDFYVYDSKKRGLLRNFATTNTLQILVINIDSFAKFSDEKKGRNIIYQDSDWGIPIKFIQAVKPIVILDEPQNMETDIRQKAIDNLNPACTLRYSATHRNAYNLIYKLDPVQAYDMGLVKKIEVDSIQSEDAFSSAYVKIKAIQSKKNSITAKIIIDKSDDYGLQKQEIAVKQGDDLFEISGKRDAYKNGFYIEEISAGDQYVKFSSGDLLYVAQDRGGLSDEIVKFQIKKTIENHLEKEKKLKERGIKVLSLFFVDRVANYRGYLAGESTKGKFAEWFEEMFVELSNDPRYKDVVPYSADQVHDGYFSQDKTGNLKDTGGKTEADNDTYSLIMKDKEKLLDIKTPLRFIFSHSALREGWDNPNVFQICTINETSSEIKKRQEIGRGLRLPVNSQGERIFDENVNILTVIANESYEDFAKSLQTEIEQECGVDFSGRIKNKKQRKKIKLKKNYQLDENFKALWERIQQKTQYNVEYKISELIEKAGGKLADRVINLPKVISRKAVLSLTEQGIGTQIIDIKGKQIEQKYSSIPDVAGYIQKKTNLTRETIIKIIEKSGKGNDIIKNPQQFMDFAANDISFVMKQLMIDGIKYEKIADQYWKMESFKNQELESYLDNLYKVEDQKKTLYDHVIYDSEIENQFVKDLESRRDVKFYIKLPNWFTIDTPIGKYNPDWAIVFENQKRVYFVAETKGVLDIDKLREEEKMKIKCGYKHFDEFADVEFKAPINKLSEIIVD